MNNYLPLIVKVIVIGITVFWLYRDSRARDYNWIMWMFMPAIAFLTQSLMFSFFIILVLLIVYLFSRPKGPMEKCPHCNKRIHHELFVCPFCRKNAKKECLVCHEPVPWEAEQCPHCRSRAITEG